MGYLGACPEMGLGSFRKTGLGRGSGKGGFDAETLRRGVFSFGMCELRS
jgi:hypothetical protein